MNITTNQVNGVDSTANDFKLALIQLEAGSVATEFEQRSIQQELALCQRYYNTVYCSARFNASAAGHYLNTNVYWPTMRATPTASELVAGSVLNVAGSGLATRHPNGARFEIFSAAAGACYILTRQYGLDAEL